MKPVCTDMKRLPNLVTNEKVSTGRKWPQHTLKADFENVSNLTHSAKVKPKKKNIFFKICR